MQELDDRPDGAVDIVIGKPIGLAGLRAALVERDARPCAGRTRPAGLTRPGATETRLQR